MAELPGLISASKPWLEQARPLLSGKEGGGVAKLLAESTPGLAGAAQAGKATALPQLNQLSLCTTKVLVPTGNQTINDRFSTGGPNYREFLYNLVNFAGAGQNFDGNGPYLRAQPGGGPLLVGEPNPKAIRKPSATRSTTPTRSRTRSATSRSSAAGRRSSRTCAATPTRSRTSTAHWARSALRPRLSRG